MKLFRTPDDTPGNGPADPPAPPAGPLIDKAPQRPPPAAEIVDKGQRTEREQVLERQLKDRETRVAELEDENRRLKTPPAPPQPPKPKHWMDDLPG